MQRVNLRDSPDSKSPTAFQARGIIKMVIKSFLEHGLGKTMLKC